MNKLLQKSKKALQSGGVIFFLKKLYGYFVVKVRLAIAWMFRPILIKKIRSFKSDNAEEVLDFTGASRLNALIRPMQVKSEFLGLLDIFKEQRPKTVLEIGTANGGTLFCFSKLAPGDATIISIDLPDGPFGGGYPKNKVPLYASFKKEGQKMFLLREDSHSEKTVEKAREILKGKQIDFLFIDGDHTYEGVKRDFELYSPLVRKGGIVDVGCLVNLFWDEIKNNYKYKEFIENKNQGWGGVGVLFF
jgi:hypothetical protein